MSWFEALLLGIIQGLTEFLPVSSSGHLELGKVLLGQEAEQSLLFSILVHAATALSTVVIFRKDIWGLLGGILQKKEEFEYSLKLVLSMIPVGIVGVFFKDQVESFFNGNTLLVGSMLIFTGFLLYISQKVQSKEGQITYGKAILIGVAQAIAVIPGISRSGSTIATALILGIKKEEAARFSFLMVLIPIFGATLLEIMDYLETDTINPQSNLSLIVGFLSAFIAGLLACQWMITLVKRSKLNYFAIYCFAAGIIAIILSL